MYVYVCVCVCLCEGTRDVVIGEICISAQKRQFIVHPEGTAEKAGRMMLIMDMSRDSKAKSSCALAQCFFTMDTFGLWTLLFVYFIFQLTVFNNLYKSKLNTRLLKIINFASTVISSTSQGRQVNCVQCSILLKKKHLGIKCQTPSCYG